MPPETVLNVIINSPNHTTLTTAVVAAGLSMFLNLDGPYTVFAPTDAAFNALPPEALERLLDPQYINHLADLLGYHVIEGQVYAANITDGLEQDMLNSEAVTFNVSGGNESTVVTVNDATVIAADIAGSNGLVHVTDAVLLPSSVTSSIVDIGYANEDLSTLMDLLNRTDLIETLDTTGPYTLFAPENDAFDDIDESTLDNVAQLREILLFHVADGVLDSDAFAGGQVVPMLSNKNVTINLSVEGEEGLTIMIGSAEVVEAKILGNNGYVWVLCVLVLVLTFYSN